MKTIYIFSQVYPPDTASISQHLGDLVDSLSEEDFEVTIFCSSRDYEAPKKKYLSINNKNISIIRIPSINYSKNNKFSRLLSFIFLHMAMFFMVYS